MIEENEEYVVIKLHFKNGEIEEYDRMLWLKENAYKYGDDMAKNHAHIINEQYYLVESGGFEEEDWEAIYDVLMGAPWFDVEWGNGYARVVSIEPISAEEAKVLDKWGW
tara:strand:+ start:2154 stop:2480 length:327 start_codon:yes stop_codon:yes gene_type:complete